MDHDAILFSTLNFTTNNYVIIEQTVWNDNMYKSQVAIRAVLGLSSVPWLMENDCF